MYIYLSFFFSFPGSAIIGFARGNCWRLLVIRRASHDDPHSPSSGAIV